MEDKLVQRGASLTYDASEARLILGKVGQKKRAALELRNQGIWTEEVISSVKEKEKGKEKLNSIDTGVHVDVDVDADEPPEKKQRRDGDGDDHANQDLEVVDLTHQGEGNKDKNQNENENETAPPNTDDDDDDGVSITSTSTVPSAKSDSTLSSDGPVDILQVIKLEWMEKSLELERLLPIDPFIVYQARITERPHPQEPDPNANTTAVGTEILQRAKADATQQPPPIKMIPSNRFLGSGAGGGGGGDSQNDIKRYRRTTSENDQDIPIPPPPDWVKNNIMYACMRSARLHPPNEQFINQLCKIRTIRELTLDEIGVRAYSTSISAIASYPYKLQSSNEVLKLPGCDMKIANLFAEFKETLNDDDDDDDTGGTLSAAKILDTDPVLKTLNEFYSIWGVGAKTAREFYFFRHWRDLDDIVEHGWNSLSRVQQIGVKYYEEFKKGISRIEIEHIANIVQRHANKARKQQQHDSDNDEIDCIIVGGYRRGKEICGDVDLIITHPDESITKDLVIDIVSSLEEEEWITHTLSLHITSSNREQQTRPFRADTTTHSHSHSNDFDSLDKALVVWQDPHPHPNHSQQENNDNLHRRVDIIVSPWRTIGCAVLGWTGDKTFERDLRRFAKKAHGWKFDSTGVRQRSGGQVVDLEGSGKTWEERERLVMEGLGVGWRDPSLRCSG